jgi:acyl dehydratase
MRNLPSPFAILNARSTLWDLGTALFFLFLYSLTLAPGLLPADAGEFQVVGAVLGVAHPPGFALYTLMSWLATRLLFFLSPATAVNALSAALAALTLVLLSRVVRRLTGSAWAGTGAALALGFSTTFWAQATTANIRMPAAFAVALALERLVIYRQSLSAPAHQDAEQRDSRFPRLGVFAVSPLGAVALALGLGVSHHGSLVFIAAILGGYALWRNLAVLHRPWPLLWGLAPFLAWLYLPLRAGAFGAPANLATPDGFLQHVLARGFSGDILYFANLQALPERAVIFGNVLTFEFTWPMLLLTVFGAIAALWRNRPLGVVLLVAVGLHAFIAMTYRAPQTVEYLLPAYLLMAVFIGFALAELPGRPSLLTATAAKGLRLSRSPRHLVSLSLAFLILTYQFLSTFPSYLTLARGTPTRDHARTLLANVPPNAVVLASWHWATPLWYLQNVERQRPDVEVTYVFPRTASLAQDWANEITSNLQTRAVVVTSFYRPEYDALPYRFIPLGPAWEVHAQPLFTPPADLIGAQSFEAWTFLGYRLESDTSPARQSVDLIAAWQTNGLPHDVQFFVHLLGADGQLYGQMDVSHRASRYVSGEVLVDRYQVVPFVDTPPGAYALAAGAYLPDGERLAEVDLTTVTITPPASPYSPAPVTFGPIHLTGHTLRPSGPVRPGDTVTVDLRFLATRPLTDDYAVKVELSGAEWSVTSEGTPVGGAIPTLKWIAGSRLADRRTLSVPAGAAPGPAQLHLVLYDSFTQQPLPILNRDLAALGPAVLLETIEIGVP